MKNLIGTFEAAKLCQVSPGTVTRWIKEGKILASLTAGGHHRILISELVRFMENLKIPIPEEMSGIYARRVLIVDDEKEVRSMIRWAVEAAFPGTRVDEAEDGFAAGWKCRDGRPHLVILDIHMPGFDGYQVMEFIRHLSEETRPSVLVISALIEPDVRKKAMVLGANDYLQKPFELSKLNQKIASLMNPLGKGRKHDAA